MKRLSVDFNKHGGSCIFLITDGTRRDLLRQGLELFDGMTALLYQEDMDVNGQVGTLEAEGIVYREGDQWAARLTSDIRFLPKSA